VTYVTPPRPSSFPEERAQLEFSSRSLVFVNDGSRILRAWGPVGAPFPLAVEPAGERWRITAWGVGPPEARRAARELFSLSHPLPEFYALVRRERVLAGTERRFRGLRLPRDANLYEAILHAILGQQLSVAAANTLKGRLLSATDSVLEVDGLELPLVPPPAALERLGERGLRGLGISGAKARSLLSLAARERVGAFEAGRFAGRPAEWAIEALDAEPGIGRWTAENALLRGLGRRDLFVAGDLGLRAALDVYGALPRSAPELAARAWGDRYYPGWGSYATLYLWRKWVADLREGRSSRRSG
jgi:3-methyladenine DNA glycosylase/8-oxoguanine DNA glycosylase